MKRVSMYKALQEIREGAEYIAQEVYDRDVDTDSEDDIISSLAFIDNEMERIKQCMDRAKDALDDNEAARMVKR